MRIAFLGPRLNYGGASYAGVQFLLELAGMGDTIDCFFSRPVDDIPTAFHHDNLRFFGQEMQRFRPMSRGAQGYFLRQGQRVQRESGSLDALCDAHATEPYDVLWVFSRAELLGVGLRLKHLPPVVIHPETHAKGEARWHRSERALALQGEKVRDYALTEAILTGRSVVQKHDLRKAQRVVAPSERFARYLVNDYGVPRSRISVVWNPVNLERFFPRTDDLPTRPVRLGFISRISVRKGVEHVVEMSRRLADLEGRVEISIIGKPTPWSNYTSLLDDLDGRIARYEGGIDGEDMGDRYRQLHGMIMPSQYEPFGLTAAEALASGLPLVASDEVGAIEAIHDEVCIVYPAGDLDAFEASIRRLVDLIEGGDRQALAQRARKLAEEHFASSRLAPKLQDAFRLAAAC